ncbi:site-specific integrase [Sphingomonas sp. LY54]|uniref:tyrosine-type recombinase/integrase n=1 Tax=Sphingomonas sp. LY54 TaxID=3095343 RepID=UPI002D778F0C|nr:site-specific integrase [Sphingomonas sp. LY54]WRP28744.1 site-specific integrase [Sphingomonas sp. LY54]
MREQPIDLYRPSERIQVFKTKLSTDGCRALEPGLFFTPSMTLLQAPTSFIRERYVENGESPSPETWEAAAYALQSWFEFLPQIGIRDWTTASRSDLIQYRDAYQVAISPKTGAAYAPITIRNRVAVILHFYQHNSKKYSGDLLEGSITLDEFRDGSSVTVSTTGSVRTTVKGIGPKVRLNRRGVRPFLTRELQAFLKAAGPQAANRDGDERPSRNRLLADFMWAVGLRLSEALGLTIFQILSICPDPQAPLLEYPLTILGKGGVERVVGVPSWLIQDATAYIEGERKECVAAGNPGQRPTPRLFLASQDSNAPGSAISERRVEQIVEEICRKAGLLKSVERVDPETGDVRHEFKSSHCVHDLRHTYAVLTYWSEKMAGNPEPWKKVQAQLGHARLSTTINTYLSFVEIFDGQEKIVDTRRLIFGE